MASLKYSCRVCLTNKEVNQPLSTDVNGSNLTEMINTICSSANIETGDKYPQNICIACFENLKNAWEFKTLCENTQNCLPKFYKEYDSNNENDEYIYPVPLTNEEVTVKIEKEIVDEEKIILDTKTMENQRDPLSFNSDFENVSVEKLNDGSATIAPLLENRQATIAPLLENRQAKIAPLLENRQATIAPLLDNRQATIAPLLDNRQATIAPLLENRPILVTNMNMFNSNYQIQNYQNVYEANNIISNYQPMFITQVLPVSFEKCITVAQSSNNYVESCTMNRQYSDTTGCGPSSLDSIKVNSNSSHNLGTKKERVKQTVRQKHNLSGGEEITLNFDLSHLQWNKKVPKAGPCPKEPNATKCETKLAPKKMVPKACPKVPKARKCETKQQKSKDPKECSICPICGKIFRSNMKHHLEVSHKGIKPFTCKFCQKSFKDKWYLRDHENQHTGKKKYLCALCGLSFVQHSGYRQHIKKHPEISPNTCKICNKAFTTPGLLRDHMNSHNNERKYSCTICLKSFFSQSGLKKHSTLHQERKHKCDQCNKVFHNNHSLKRHMVVHTGDKPYQCDVCNAKFSQKPDMKKHIMRHFNSIGESIPRLNKESVLSTYEMQSDLSYP